MAIVFPESPSKTTPRHHLTSGARPHAAVPRASECARIWRRSRCCSREKDTETCFQQPRLSAMVKTFHGELMGRRGLGSEFQACANNAQRDQRRRCWRNAHDGCARARDGTLRPQPGPRPRALPRMVCARSRDACSLREHPILMAHAPGGASAAHASAILVPRIERPLIALLDPVLPSQATRAAT